MSCLNVSVDLGKQRLHSWLSENGLLFYDLVTLGNNFSGLVSQVKLNSLITVTNGYVGIGEQIRAAKTDAEMDEILDGDTDRNREVFNYLYQDYFTYASDEERDAFFDRVALDVHNLDCDKFSNFHNIIVDHQTKLKEESDNFQIQAFEELKKIFRKECVVFDDACD